MERQFVLRPDALAAFTQLYDERAAAVYRYFYHQIGHVEDAEDLTDTTFSTALCQFAEYRPERGTLTGWVFGVAHNCLRDYRRGRPVLEQLPLELEDPRPLPDGQLLSAERALALQRAIRQLPPDQRDAIALRFFAGLRTREVAGVLCKSEGAVKMLVHRAVDALRHNPVSEDLR
jgi:RNA polymerase sigma-70 factor, ECF subfamily